MVSFDEVLPKLVQVCETQADFEHVERATVVRDLRGRVRLALRIAKSKELDTEALETALKNALGQWFAAPILAPNGDTRTARLRNIVLQRDAPWTDASWNDPIRGRQCPPIGRWHRVERHLSKPGWLDAQKTTLPWPLRHKLPPIVTFYSFKGGVGRTTLLASTAWQLALDGKRGLNPAKYFSRGRAIQSLFAERRSLPWGRGAQARQRSSIWRTNSDQG